MASSAAGDAGSQRQRPAAPLQNLPSWWSGELLDAAGGAGGLCLLPEDGQRARVGFSPQLLVGRAVSHLLADAAAVLVNLGFGQILADRQLLLNTGANGAGDQCRARLPADRFGAGEEHLSVDHERP